MIRPSLRLLSIIVLDSGRKKKKNRSLSTILFVSLCKIPGPYEPGINDYSSVASAADLSARGFIVGIGYLGSVFLIICKKSILFQKISMTFFLLWSHTFAIIPKPILWFGEDFGELENFPKHRGRVYFVKEGFTPSQNTHDCGSFVAK